jgi:hypothetical protein
MTSIQPRGSTSRPADGSVSSTATLRLEEVGRSSWWAALVTTATSPAATAWYGYVVRGGTDPGGPVLYRSATVAVPRPLLPTTPTEQWAPGLRAALEEIEAELARDGWLTDGRGADADLDLTLTLHRADQARRST